jgi:hypothetical protein
MPMPIRNLTEDILDNSRRAPAILSSLVSKPCFLGLNGRDAKTQHENLWQQGCCPNASLVEKGTLKTVNLSNIFPCNV